LQSTAPELQPAAVLADSATAPMHRIGTAVIQPHGWVQVAAGETVAATRRL
jgi:hypothetical protein